MYICKHTCIYICICIPKYNLLSTYNVTSMYVFKVPHNKLMCFSLGGITSALSFAQLAAVLCVELRPSGLFPVQLGIFVGHLFVQFIFEAHSSQHKTLAMCQALVCWDVKSLAVPQQLLHSQPKEVPWSSPGSKVEGATQGPSSAV